MAEGIASGIAGSLLTKVASTAFKEIGLLYGVKDELKKLENTLTTINAVLADAEEKQEKNHAVRIWIKRLEQVVYDADDLLAEFAYEELRRKLDNRIARQVSDFFSSSNQLAFHYKMGHAIKEIIERLDEIAKDISKFNFLSKTVMPVNTRFFGNRERETVSYVSTSEIIGRDIEKEEIIEKLIGVDSNTSDGVPVIAIVGIGGLGKTSLAKLVFNDKRVVEHFELKIWVCVSEDFDRKLIVKNILRSITNERVEEELVMEHLQIRLRKNLDGKKYLLVLDDVWNEEKDKWIQLEELLMVGANGMKIVVTTRSSNVATAMGLYSPVFLNGLTNEKSWQLFEKLAFTEGLEKVNPKIIEIGKELIKRCKGVPLAIRTLGSTMGSKTSESEWLSIQNNEIWSSSPNDGGILSVLKLSYDQLPIHIKYCFAYCSIFPKDYNFRYEVLIQLWMAQGYVQSSSNGHTTLEYMGDQYIKDLLSISFFQEVEVDDSGNIRNFKMHDLIHDLAIGVARSNCYCLTESSMKNGNYDESIRHISLECQQLMEELPRQVLKAKGMRTLFCRDRYGWEMGLSCQHTIMSNLTCLRVLDLNSCGIRKLASSIGTLKHLRYLDLSNNRFLEGVPNSISNLLNLQTLNLNGCMSIKHLPKDITKLNNLRYLLIEKCQKLTHMPSGLGKLTTLMYLMLDGCSELTHMPPGLGKLTMMQKLPLFVVGNDKTVGHSCYGRLRELKGLNDLSGKIWIKNLELVEADDAAAEAILKEKKLLQSLELEWKSRESTADNAKEEKHSTTAELVLEGLEPHPNLKKLLISWYCGVRFPGWMIKMVNVVKISLWSCQRCQLLQPLDQLPCLKSLDLFNLVSLEYIQEEEEEEEEDNDNNNHQVRDGHPPPPSSYSSSTALLLFFPSLQQLELKALPKLKGWWKRRRESVSKEEEEEKYTSSPSSSSLVFPQLTKLSITRCPMFTSMPLHPNLEELKLYRVSEKLVRERLTTTTTTITSTAAAEEEEERKVDRYHHHHQLSSSSNIFSSSSISSKLKSLHIQDLEVLLPEFLRKNLTSLEIQKIDSCPTLLCLTSSSSEAGEGEGGGGGGEGFRYLTSLRTLEIRECAKLKSISREVRHLTALEDLDIHDCPELELSDDNDGIHWQGLRSLRKLDISIIPKLVTLPVGIQHLTTLQILKIHKCDKFLAVPDWIGNLTQLQKLRLSHCPKLASMPQEIRCYTSLQHLGIYKCPNLLSSLPEGIRCLTSLQQLHIYHCSSFSSVINATENLLLH